jgi:hypothetical protein
MTKQKIIAEFLKLAVPPKTGSAAWYVAAKDDALAFLREQFGRDHIPIFADLAPSVLLHGILAPNANLAPPDFDDLQNSWVDPSAGWRIEHVSGGGQPDRVYLSDPFSDRAGSSLQGGEKLIFIRHFYGMKNYAPPIEISQKMFQALNVYRLDDRQAYCRLDDRGDVEEVIRIFRFPIPGQSHEGKVVTIHAASLQEYLSLSDMSLVVKFDVTRYPEGHFSGWDDGKHEKVRDLDLGFNSQTGGSASFANGNLIVRARLSRDEFVAQYVRRSQTSDANQYVSFKILDWRNKKKLETSCAPEFRTNYFVKAPGLPFETSPAFFRPEVLHKYKADPDKYTLDSRSISCRNAWHLQSYDINEAGQIHAYIVHLAHLPYEEQLYWRSFNEWPKAGISKRAYESDFEASWSTDRDPVQALKHHARELDDLAPDWWIKRGDAVISVVHSPASDAQAEWANEVLALDQMIVEGFSVKALRSRLTKAGATVEKDWGSLRLMQALLTASGVEPEDAAKTIDPLKALHTLRSKLKGHAAVRERRELEANARREFETLRAHFLDLASKCDDAMRVIRATLMPKIAS